MQKLLKNKKALLGLLVAGAIAYYLYKKNKKERIKANAEVLASTPADGVK
jgi:hypothetical protein